MKPEITHVQVIGEPLRDRLRHALKRYKLSQTKFGLMFGLGKMAVSHYITGKRQIPARYWPLMERWIATGVAPEWEDVERLRATKNEDPTSRSISLEELSKVGAVSTTAEAADFFGYRLNTFRGLIQDNRDFNEAFNQVAKDKLPIIQIENMASIGGSLEDIATVFDCTVEHVQRVFQCWNEYEAAFDKGRALMRMSILKRQFEIMQNNDKFNIKSAASMAMFLGKVYLDQNDAPAKKSAKESVPTETIVRWATEQEAADFRDGVVSSLTAVVNE